MNDIDCTGVDMEPLWPSGFYGIFDGNEHSITGISLTGSGNVGLFATTNSAQIFDLTLAGTVTNESSLTGALIGEAYNTLLYNISSTVAVTGANNNIGGLVGFMHYDENGTYTLTNLSVDADIYASATSESVGGIFGYFGQAIDATEISTTLDDLHFSGSIDYAEGTQATNVGGLIGFLQVFKDGHGNHNLILQNSSVEGAGVSAFFAGGGFIGKLMTENQNEAYSYDYTEITVSVSDSTANIPVTLELNVGGGFIGHLLMLNDSVADQHITLSDVTALGDVTGQLYIGGFLGTLDGTLLTPALKIASILLMHLLPDR